MKFNTMTADDKTTAHTPGPWVYDVKRRNVLATDGAIICRNGDSVYGVPADGHLLASAPDMLAALRLFVAEYSGGPERNHRAEMAAALAAIAKAEGRDQ